MKMKDFRNGVDGLVIATAKLQDSVQDYIKVAFGYLLKDYNTSGLSYLFNAFNDAEKVRFVDVNALEGYFYLLTGGDTGITKNGLPLYDKEKSYLEWNAETKSYQLKGGATFDPEYVNHMLETFPFYLFIPKKRPPLYQFKALLHAVSKAEKNQLLLTAEEKKLVKDIRKTINASGVSLQ